MRLRVCARVVTSAAACADGGAGCAAAGSSVQLYCCKRSPCRRLSVQGVQLVASLECNVARGEDPDELCARLRAHAAIHTNTSRKKQAVAKRTAGQCQAHADCMAQHLTGRIASLLCDLGEGVETRSLARTSPITWQTWMQKSRHQRSLEISNKHSNNPRTWCHGLSP